MRINHEANAAGLFLFFQVFGKFAFLLCGLACVFVWSILSTLQGVSYVTSAIATYYFVDKVIPDKMSTLWTVVLAAVFFVVVSEIVWACIDRRVRARHRGFWGFLPKLKKALTSPIDPTHAGAAVGFVAAAFSARHVFSMDLTWYSMAGLMLVVSVAAFFIVGVATALLWESLFPVKKRSQQAQSPAAQPAREAQEEHVAAATEQIAAGAAAAAPLRLEDMTHQQILDQTRRYIESAKT